MEFPKPGRETWDLDLPRNDDNNRLLRLLRHPIESLTLQASDLSEVYALPEDSEKPDPRPTIFRGQDLQQNRAVAQRSFQPGLTQYVVAAWAQNKTEPLPTELTLTLSEFTYRASSVYGGMYWFDKKEKFSINIPVEELEQ